MFSSSLPFLPLLRRHRRIFSSLPLPSSSSALPPPVPFTQSGEPDLFRVPVRFQTDHREEVQLDAVYQDTNPSAARADSASPTVVLIHGSPGSHKDFKYMVPMLRDRVRTVAFNWPGLGYTPFDRRLRATNTERTAFARALLNQMVPSPQQFIFVGHSRGGDNAIRLANAYADRTKALFLINSTGFRHHRGVRPHWYVRGGASLWAKASDRTQQWVAPIYQWLHGLVGLRTDNGHVAGWSALTHCTYDFDKLRPLLDTLLHNHPHMRIVFAYSGRDPLIEREISEEFARALGGPTLESVTEPKQEDPILLEKYMVRIRTDRTLSMFFAKESHFLQKHQGQFMAKCILAMMEQLKGQ